MAKGSAEYNAGVKAFQEGKAYSSFPGKRSEPGTEDWINGWVDANLKKGPAFQNGRTKALEAISNRHPILNSTPFIQEVGKNEFRLVVDGKTAFTGSSQKECMEWAKSNGINGLIDYSDK